MNFDLLKQHWKPLAVVAAVTLAFSFGRSSVPERIERVSVEKYTEAEYQKMISDEVTRRVKILEETLREAYAERITEIEISKPDGTKIKTKTSEKVSEKLQTKVEIQKVEVEKRVEVEKLVYKDREVLKREVIENRKPFRIGAFATANIPGAISGSPAFEFGVQGQLLIPRTPVFVALSVGHRLTVGVVAGFEF